MTPLRLVLAGAAGSAAADFGDQDPRGLTHAVIGSLVVRGNRLAISNSSSLSGCELHGSSFRARLPVADFGDQVDLALGFQREEVGVLEDFAVDRHRYAFLDLAAEAGVPAVELEHHAGEIVRRRSAPRSGRSRCASRCLRQAALAGPSREASASGRTAVGCRQRISPWRRYPKPLPRTASSASQAQRPQPRSAGLRDGRPTGPVGNRVTAITGETDSPAEQAGFELLVLLKGDASFRDHPVGLRPSRRREKSNTLAGRG